MTIRAFQIFRTVCETESVTAAAERLGVSQPAVSAAVKELETAYGVSLFDRMNRRIYLTQEGRVLRRYADQILALADEAAAAVRDGRGEATCRLGVNMTVAETVLSDLMARLKRALPGTEIAVRVHNCEAIERMLAENELDAAIIDRAALPGTVSEPLWEDRMLVVAGPWAPDRLSAEELAGQRLLLREKGSGSRECVDALFASLGRGAAPAAESTSTLGLAEMARCGMGYAVFPERLAGRFCADGRLKPVALDGGPLKRTYYLVRMEKKYVTAAADRMMNAVKACFAEGF